MQGAWLSKSYVAEASRGKSLLLHFSGLNLPLARSPLRSLPALAGRLVSPTKVRALAVSITKRNLDFLRVGDSGKESMPLRHLQHPQYIDPHIVFGLL